MPRRVLGSSRALITTIIIIVATVLIVFLFVWSRGYYVGAKIHIEGDNVEITQCYLAKLYPIEMAPPSENVTQGDKSLVLIVTKDDIEVLRVERENLGEGFVTIRTEPIPGDIETGTRLVVTTSLYRGSQLLSQASIEPTR